MSDWSGKARRVVLTACAAVLAAIALLASGGPALAHNAAFTLTSVEWNARAGSLEVIHRLHAEHALEAIEAAGGARTDTLVDLKTLARLGLYVDGRFQLADGDGAALPLEFVGAEPKGEFVFVYQEIPLPRPPRKISVASELMRDLPGEHVNHVNVRIGGRAGTLIFGRDRTSKLFDATPAVVGGAASGGPPDMTPPAASMAETISRYLVIGYQHIIPMGIDHILFVLGLVLSTTKLRALIWQVSAFTLAHSATLALATLGLVDAPPRAVEALIALSIAYVGVENIILRRPSRSRLAIVFAFGLLHGLGFAGALSDIGLPTGQLALSLAAFNVGVEFGQFTIVAIAFAALRLLCGDPRHRRAVVLAGSIGIAVAGAYWTISRLFAP